MHLTLSRCMLYVHTSVSFVCIRVRETGWSPLIVIEGSACSSSPLMLNERTPAAGGCTYRDIVYASNRETALHHKNVLPLIRAAAFFASRFPRVHGEFRAILLDSAGE
jgi:hypothetical protein